MASKGQGLKNRTGEKFTTNEGYEITIVEYINADNCTIQFEDGTIVRSKAYWSIVNGKIGNPMHKSLFGVGYIGVGKYSGIIHRKIYNKWYCMFQRCYEEAYQNRCITYIGCTVDPRWHNFQVFAEWYEEKYVEGFQLDKDIKVKGNKTYSPETCCFVPGQINSLFKDNKSTRVKYPPLVTIGNQNKYRAVVCMYGKNKYFGYYLTPQEALQVHKTQKEVYIKEIANFWKDKIEPMVYQILMNYQVEIAQPS